MSKRQINCLHPWHGISPGVKIPNIVTAYIEIVPTDTVKYEVDKESGFLKVDRPQKYSSLCPTLYGFIPQSYCAERVAQLGEEKSGYKNLVGDGDPLDICVLTERPITNHGILVTTKPVGGLRMIDHNEADDKIIAVLVNDPVYGAFDDISDIPAGLVERLRHYFLTYKEIPGEVKHQAVEIPNIYGREEAFDVINRSFADYKAHYR